MVLIARLSLALAALVACAWFVLGARQAHDLNAAAAIVAGNTVSRAQAAHAASLLSSAGTLNPDSNVKLTRAALAFRRGDAAQAIALTQQVLRAEPDNPIAWTELAQVSSGNLPVLLAAFRHIRELTPPVRHVR